MKRCILFTFFFLSVLASIRAQVDSAYIQSFPEEFTIRPYVYKKFTNLTTEYENERTMYHPNTPVGLGVGFTYRGYALNLAWAPPFLRDKELGKTQYIDFQYHYYGRSYLFDFYFQNYKGFYTKDGLSDRLLQLHGDIRVIQYGASAEYVFNHRKFSYRAAFYCNEKQVRSAGSFQVGGGFYYNKLETDTTQILTGQDWFRNYQFSITGGYVHTFVFKKDYFFTIGLSTGINLGLENIKRNGEKLEVTPVVYPRSSFGYNGDKWALYLSVVYNRVQVTRSGDMDITFDTGRASLSYVHRLGYTPSILKKIKLLNR